ncbi:MFS transporter [Skermania sp. ID1734]|uniref:MFS transporter n=1 Tax=Skermania sp. ID1734 TaxID=2597516 RepID=UPI00117E0787|nr:MFS transporter [Skermania sp. ID1734]
MPARQHVIERRSLVAGRVLVFLAIVSSALTLRVAVTAFTPLAEQIGADIGFSHAVIGVFGMMPTAMFAAFGLLTPTIATRIGLERTALLAMLLAGAGMLARAFTSDTATMVVFTGMALGGMGIGNVILPPLVKRYFSDRLALLSSMYITMVQVGTVLPALVAVPVADAAGWRISIGMWALLGFAAAFPWLFVLADRRGHDVLDRTATSARRDRIRPWRSSLGWGMAGLFGMTSLITYSMFTWLPAILVDAGASRAFGGTMVALFAFLGLLSALTAPIFCARMRNPFPVVAACAVAYLVAFAGLVWAPMAAPVVWVVILGLGPSTFPMSLTLINLRTRTQSGSSALSGFTQGVGYTVACLGPLLFGILRDQTGSWLPSFGILLAAVVVVVVSGWAACKPRVLEDTV